MERFGLSTIWRAHWDGLSGRDSDHVWPSNVRFLVLLLPLAFGILLGLGRVQFDKDVATAFLASAALGTGAMVGAFTQVSAWRERITNRDADYALTDQPTRDMLDEAVAHMMQVIVDAMAISLGSIVLIALGPIEGGWQRATAIVASATLGAIGTHLGLAMIFLVTQLYAAYGHRNRIRRALDGNEPHVRPQVRRSKKAKSPKGAD